MICTFKIFICSSCVFIDDYFKRHVESLEFSLFVDIFSFHLYVPAHRPEGIVSE